MNVSPLPQATALRSGASSADFHAGIANAIAASAQSASAGWQFELAP